MLKADLQAASKISCLPRRDQEPSFVCKTADQIVGEYLVSAGQNFDVKVGHFPRTRYFILFVGSRSACPTLPDKVTDKPL